MKHNSKLNRSRWLLLTLFTLIVGISPAWGETLTANFDSGLPEGWSIVGSITNDNTRYRTGKGLWTSAKSTTDNYVITDYVEGTFDFYARAYNTKYASTVDIYEYTGSGLGTLLYSTGSMYTTSTPSWTKYTTTISSATQLAIVLNYAAIDDVTYTEGALTFPTLTVANTTAVSATLEWNQIGEETAWQVSYSADAEFDPSSNPINVTSKSYTLTGLTEGTIYYAYVRIDYGNGTYSDWSKKVSFKATNEKEVTINEANTYTSYVPFYGYGIDNGYGNGQIIIPASDLSTMSSRKITKMVFYSRNDNTTYRTTDFNGAEFEIYLQEVENETFASNTITWSDGMTKVYSGSLTVSDYLMTITLDAQYVYNGGNLLIGFKQTKNASAYKFWYWIAKAYTPTTTKLGLYQNGNNTNSINYIPKITFTSLPATTVNVTGVTLNESELTLEAGQNETLTAIISPNDATDSSVSWESSDEDVATVDNGIVTGVGAGTATITVTTTDGGFTATCEVTVNAATPVSGVSLNKESTTIFVGGSETLQATVAPDNATNKNITWTSSDETVATVTEGTVNAIKAGTATITVTTEDGSKTATCTVTVQNVAVTGMTLSESAVTMIAEETLTLVPTFEPSDATIKTVTWESSNTDVATVDENGIVTAVANGTATITATSSDNTSVKATCTVKVTTAETMTVNEDGTDTNEFIPFYGYYSDNANTGWSQFIIPSSELGNIDGGEIKKLKFYTNSNISWSGSASTAQTYKVYIKEVDYTAFSSKAFTDWTAEVGEVEATFTGQELVVNLSSYKYNGGNLMIGFKQTVSGKYSHTYWYGKNTSENSAVYTGTSSTTYNYGTFIPKTTFSYIPSDKPKMEVSDASIDFGLITTNSTTEDKQKTITISNAKGRATLEGISVSMKEGSDSQFTLSEGIATSVAAGEETSFTVTFTPGEKEDYAGTIVISATDQATVEVELTATYRNNPASIAVTLGEDAIGETIEFGTVNKQTVKTFSITNSGDLPLTITSITSSNATDFTVQNAPETVAGGETETFDVTFVFGETPVYDAEKTATITIKNSAGDDVTFNVTGTRIEQWSEDFAGNAKPDGWEVTGYTDKWTFENGIASSSYSSNKGYLETPLLTVAENDVLSFQAKSTFNGSVTIKVYKKAGAGDWENTAFKTISLTSSDYGIWKDYTIEGLSAGTYKFRFENEDYALDNFEGFKRVQAPEFSVYSDDTYTNEKKVTMAESTDFGFVDEEKTTAYYIKNTGLSAMSLAAPVAQSPLTASFSDASVGVTETGEGDAKRWNIPVDGTIKLNITMSNTAAGQYTDKTVTVTADDEVGTFVASYSGIVTDANHYNIDFATAAIPNDWTDDGEYSNWTKNNEGYISTTGSSNLTTSALVATTGDKLYIQRDGSALTIKYKKLADENFSNLQSLAYTSKKKIDEITMPDGLAADKILLQFSGSGAKIYRIYGLSEPSEPVMVVYDNEEVAGSTHNFGNVSDEADATWTLTVKNEGKAILTGLAAALSGTNAAHYSVQVSATELAVNATATITVKQLKDNLGAHEATLTISADDPIADKVITLSGFTYDHNKMFVDFENGNLPAGWTKGANWSVGTQVGGNYALSTSSSTATTVLTSPLAVEADEVLMFDATRYYSSYAPTLKVRYTTDAGNTWSDYVDYSSQITNSYSGTNYLTLSLTDVPAGTVIVEFTGAYVRLDNIMGFAPTTAPVLSLTESAVAVANGSTKEFGNLTEAGTATYTLSNTGTANLVSTVATTGVATAAISGEGEGVTISENTVTLAPGKSATITLTVPFAAPYGEKAGAMTISSEGWVADMVVNYTATTIDPTALYVDFNDNTKPAGWYNSGWTITGQRAANYSQSEEKSFITSLLTVEGTDDVLTFDAQAYFDGYTESITVSYSTDRKNWTPIVELDKNDIDGTLKTFDVKGLAAGNYYLKISGKYVYLDNIMGWHYKTPVATRDLYIASATFPTGALIPETENGVEASVKVYSLQSNETGVYAKLFFDETLVATSATQTIAKDGNETLELTGNVPATEKIYAAKIVVYYSDNSVAWETDAVDVEVAHTRTLSITEFTRDGEGEIDANASNQFSAAFNVTVQNTGSIAATPVVKIFIGETEVGSATADAEIAAGESKKIAVNVTNASAGEGGELAFTAKAFWTAEDPEAKATFASDVVITVNAVAPKFNLNYKDGAALADGDNVDYGLVKAATIKTFTISNTGTANLELVSIVAPTGFSATEVTEGNKNIAIDGSLDIAVTLNAEQGKKSGNLVITYKVDESTNKTFTLQLSGRSVAADTWTVAFDDAEGSIPANWVNEGNNWEISKENGSVYNHSAGKTLTTPRLTATADEELTFDLAGANGSYPLLVEYSTDGYSWTEYDTYTTNGEKTFTAPAAGDYYIRFNGRYDNLSNFVGFKLATTVPVTISQYGYTTFTSMSNIDADELPDGIEVFYVKSEGVDDSYVRLTKAEGNIPAGTGLILKGTADTEYNLNIATGTTTALEGNLMVGCLEATPLAANASSYVLINNTDEGRAEFQSLAEYGITILAGKAYLKVDGAGAGARLMIFDDGETTGISSVLRQQARDGRVYNLNGQRVENPKKGQLYIINGKQTVVK